MDSVSMFHAWGLSGIWGGQRSQEHQYPVDRPKSELEQLDQSW